MQNTIELPVYESGLKRATQRLTSYIRMTKLRQTGLLLVTALAGFMSVKHEALPWQTVYLLLGSLFMAVSGSTVLNMAFDRDIDRVMKRTAGRPLPAGVVRAPEALILGAVLSFAGVAWAFTASPLFGLVVFLGLAFDMLYTLWLKRRTPWSILLGGIAGGMPVLAGRVLATGGIDPAGALLAIAVVCWIPTHIVTFAIKHARDYSLARVPVFPNVYGEAYSRRFVAGSTTLAVSLIVSVSWLTGLPGGLLAAVTGLGAAMAVLSLATMLAQRAQWDHMLFKAASFYMLAVSVVIAFGVHVGIG